MNQQLLVSSVHQHELTAAAEKVNDDLRAEMVERERAVATLRESEERYRTLFDLGPVAVYSCNTAGVIDRFNRRAAELWGRRPAPGDTNERFCGSFKLFRPDGKFMPHEQCPMAEVVSGKIPAVHDAEVLIERPDGSRVTVIVNIRPLKNERAQITGAINCFYDITERKQTENARARLAAIVESSGDAIISKDLNGIITSWNRGAERLFGYSADEAIGQPITMLIPPGHLDEVPRILDRIRHGESIEHYETVRRRKDGMLLDISLTVSPIRNLLGQIVGASKVARDITDRKLAEESLRESEARLSGQKEAFQAAVNGAPLGASLAVLVRTAMQQAAGDARAAFYTVDANGRCLHPVTEAGGMPDSYFRCVDGFEIGPNSPSCGMAAYFGRTVIASDVTEDPLWAPWRNVAREHNFRACWSFPIQTLAGKVVGTFAMYSPRPRQPDQRELELAGTLTQAAAIIISRNTEAEERHRAEDALRQARDRLARQADELEHQVVERTARLRDTVHELEAFSYSVAHDMRAPLRSMHGFATRLLDEYAGQLNQTGAEYLKRIARSSTRLDHLIQDVLNYTKILRAEVPLEQVDLDRLIHDIIDTYADFQPPKADLRIQGTLPSVRANQAWLTQCFSNLLSNAVKFVSPATVPDVKIWAEPINEHVRVWIQDNGIGIASQDRDRIFRLFERVYPDQQFQGTGIGLTIARKAVERMGGDLGFESELGRGTRFWVQLQKGSAP